MIFLSEAILVLPVNVIMAAWHAHLIQAQKPIRHGWWATIFAFLLIGVIGWQRAVLLPLSIHTGAFVLACACGRLVVFNISLNLFRGLSWSYVSKTSTSIIDRVEIRLFGSRVWLMEAVLFLLFVFLQFFI